MDVNKTIIAHDSANNKSVDHALIDAFANIYKARWDPTLSHEISYMDYVKQHLVPGEKSDHVIRKQRKQKVLNFFNALKEMNDERFDDIAMRFERAKKKISEQQGIIFNSFYRLISYLEDHHIPYILILRSFGADMDAVCTEIEQYTPIQFSWNAHFERHALIARSFETNKEITIDSYDELFYFFAHHGHIRVRDNFDWWNSHKEQAAYGKLFPLSNTQSIRTVFFDDHAHNDIINPRDITTGSFVDPEVLIEHGTICAVNMLEALENDDYFISYLHKMSFA